MAFWEWFSRMFGVRAVLYAIQSVFLHDIRGIICSIENMSNLNMFYCLPFLCLHS